MIEASGPWDRVVAALAAESGPVAVVAIRADLVPALVARPETPLVLVPPPSPDEVLDPRAARGEGLVVVEVPVARAAPVPLAAIAALRAAGHQVGAVLVDADGSRALGGSGWTDPDAASGWEAGALVALLAAGIRTIRGADPRFARQALAIEGARRGELPTASAAATSGRTEHPPAHAADPGATSAPAEPSSPTIATPVPLARRDGLRRVAPEPVASHAPSGADHGEDLAGRAAVTAWALERTAEREAEALAASIDAQDWPGAATS